MKTDSCEECKEQRKVTREISKQLSKLKDQNEFLKNEVRKLGRYETKRVKKIQDEHKKKFEWLKSKIEIHKSGHGVKVILQGGTIGRDKVLDLIDKTFKEEK